MAENDGFVIIRDEPVVVKLEDNGEVFGEVAEVTSRALGAERTNMSIVTLWGKDKLHLHPETEETYICKEGEGEIHLNGMIYEFRPGTRVIIRPGNFHAAGPKKDCNELVFICVASPAFDPEDVLFSPRGRNW